jgi:Xaa-Pro dipeptidase
VNRAGLALEPRLQAILAQEYPRFSDAEYARRQAALGDVMQKHAVDHLLVVSNNRAGNATQWLTAWPGTVEALTTFAPGERMTMFMEWHNHVPLARRIARDVDVHWGEHQGIAKTIAELQHRGARTVGVIGPLPAGKLRALEAVFAVKVLDADYTRLRMIKSAEELDWLRIGAALSDAGLAALMAGARPGLDERELSALVESGYLGHGGTTMIHYIGCTPMHAPQIHVPRQYPSPRKLADGDVLFCELSAFWWDYAGQVLRTMTVGAEPTPLYRDLHQTAEDAFDAVTKVIRHGTTMQAIVDASGVIEARGFTVCDDLLHGFGGGYFQPILGSRSRPAGKLPDMVLEENMTVVVQPNVTTTGPDEDRRAGVQVGELIRVTKTGFERLHRAARQLARIA